MPRKKKPPAIRETTILGIQQHFNVKRKSVEGWRARPDFPKPIRHEGRKLFFDFDAVILWKAEREKELAAARQASKAATQRRGANRLQEIKTKRLEWEFERDQGQWLRRDETIAFFERVLAYSKATLKHMAAYIESELPGGLPAGAKKRIREVVNRAVRDHQQELQALIEQDEYAK